MNHKRLFRLYREERLVVRRRGGRKRALGTRPPMVVPQLPNDRWSLDFVSDQFVDGRRLRILVLVDDCTRECLALIPDTSISGTRVARELEFTGRKYPKAKHRFELKGSPITAISGIWKPPQGNHPPSFTMLTTAPGPDVAPYHSRQVVVLRPEDWGAWLRLSKSEEQLLRPLDAGALEATTVRGESE